jgi:signal transduction histidine kinase
VYPLGESSAAIWQARYPGTALGQLHVRERHDALGLLGQLGDDNLDALLRGERLLLEGDVLWLLHDQQWQRHAPAQWQALAQRQGIIVAAQGAGSCEDVVSGLCINTRAPAGWQWLAAATTLACVLLLTWALWQRWRLQTERRIALQMLAHELRTPIGFLAGVGEELRSDFDRLPPSAQQSVGCLLSGVARLDRLAQASRDYLSADTFTAERVAVNLREWLELVSERCGASLTLRNDTTLDLPFYWLDLALDNVLRNAQQHGAAPIAVTADWAHGRLTIAVRDSGGMARYRLGQLQNRGTKGSGFGLGLTIVRHVLKRLGGRLTLAGPPTCFTITLPCQPSAGEPA